jgi:hypothetical protein
MRPGNQERILHGAVFHEHDGRVRMRGAEFADARFDALLDFVRHHVGQAIEDIDRRIQFGEQAGHFGFHFAIAGKTEIDGRPVESPSQIALCTMPGREAESPCKIEVP